MAVADSKANLDDLASLFSAGAIGGLSDGDLLARFARGRGPSAESAFAALVDQHGSMVLGTCRRVTGDRHAADDAFQAVFLVLARRADAIRLGADDSIGPWLHGVSVRVARRARSSAARSGEIRGLDGLDPIDPSSTIDPCEIADLRAAIDAEIARLPPRYRSAVVLCHLEGLSQEQVARRLRCPVGTVQSRLHRARERLRSGLARKGLGPAIGLISGGNLRAAVPPDLARATASIAARISAGEALASAASATVAGLVGYQLRNLIVKQLAMISGVVALGLATTGGAVGLARFGDDPKPAAEAKPVAKASIPDPSLAESLERIRRDYEEADRSFHAFYRGSSIPKENMEKALKVRPDLPAFVRRIADVATASPKDPAARDAMIWVIEQTSGYGDDGPYAGEIALAASWLLRNFGDDPDAIRIGLDLSNTPTANRDHLLLGFLASAKSRESKGLARLALAQYLELKSKMAKDARKVEGRRVITHIGVIGEDGKPFDLKQDQSDEGYAYLLHLKQCDVDYLRSEAERLYAEVIADYGDIPYIRSRDRELEALLRQPDPKWNGEPISAADLRKLQERLAHRPTLAQAAEARLDDWHNLAAGKMAPAIEGADASGNPLKLSDYRGKVVAIVFWGTWCGPCMREIPREKALVEKMKGRPFAMLGVNTDADPEVARKAMASEGITWPNWLDGEAGEGPITRLYHVPGYPTIYVLDAEGKIRSKGALGETLDTLVETMVTEREAAGK